MKRETTINSSTRKFIAQRKLVHAGKFEPKPLKKNRLVAEEKAVDKSFAQNSLNSVANYISLMMSNTPETFVKGGVLFTQILGNVVTAAQHNLTFSTPAGGKNVLMTEKVTEGQDILSRCNTTQLNVSVIPNITSLITQLCDGSKILALNGTNPLLNTTTDPSLKCIESKFNSSCESSMLTLPCIVIGSAIALAACCGCYCIARKCRKRPEINDQVSSPLLYPPRRPRSDDDKIHITVSPVINSNSKGCC